MVLRTYQCDQLVDRKRRKVESRFGSSSFFFGRGLTGCDVEIVNKSWTSGPCNGLESPFCGFFGHVDEHHIVSVIRNHLLVQRLKLWKIEFNFSENKNLPSSSIERKFSRSISMYGRAFHARSWRFSAMLGSRPRTFRRQTFLDINSKRSLGNSSWTYVRPGFYFCMAWNNNTVPRVSLQ